MRNIFRALREERVQPALALVNANGTIGQDDLVTSRRGLTSADAASALGVDPNKSTLQLWLEKTADDKTALAPSASDETTPAYWSTLLEPLIASVYTKRTGRRLRRLNVVRSRHEQPWMLANLGWEVLGTPGVQLFDCVSVGKEDLLLWADGFAAHMRVNVMHLLAVTGKQAVDVAVLLGGLELRIYRIERDEAAIDRLVRLEAAFWSLVERNETPVSGGSQLMLELVQS